MASTLKVDVIRGRDTTTTKLGGDLDLDGNDITGTGDIPAANLTGTLPAINGSSLTGISAQKNIIINGDFDIWQRGTSVTSAADGVFLADRFKYRKVGAMVHDMDREQNAPTVAQSSHLSTYSLTVDCTTIDASMAATDFCYIGQRIEGYNYRPIHTQTFTLSFWHKHTKTGTYCVSFQNYSQDRSYVAEYTQSVTNTWEKATITVSTAPSGGGWSATTNTGIDVIWTIAAGSNYNVGTVDTWNSSNVYATSNQVNACDSTSNNFMIAQVQLEAGSVATDFEIRNHATELAMCKRYYEEWNNAGTASYNFGIAATTSTTLGRCILVFEAEKRAAPTVTISAAGDFRCFTSSGSEDVTSLSAADATPLTVQLTVGVAGNFIANGSSKLQDDGNSNSRVYISAEL